MDWRGRLRDTRRVLGGGIARSARRAARLAGRPAPLLVALATLACLPVLRTGLPWSHDIKPHLVWADRFGRQLAAGEIYPRWLLDVADGFGAPVFFIYPPLTYYVTSALEPIFPDVLQLPGRLAVAGWLFVCASALAMYFWLRRHVGTGPALVGAAVYTLLPYHLLADLVLRAALAELLAFTWPPLLLAAVDAAAARPRRALVLGALAAAGLLLTHAPSALTFLPLPLAYAGLVAARARSLRPLAVAAGQLALGVGLAGGYLATALSHGPYINQTALYTGHFAYAQWFLQLGSPERFVALVHAHALAVSAACAGVAAAVAASFRRAPPPRAAAGLALASAATAFGYLFLMLPQSVLVWELVPLLQKIQFPWRLNGQLVLLGSACLAAGLAHVEAAFPARARAARAAALGLVLALLAGHLWAAASTRDLFGIHYKPISARRVIKVLEAGDPRPEYVLPRERDPRSLLPDGARAAIVSGGGEVRVESWRPRELVLAVRADAPARLAVRQQFYPGWRAWIDGQPCCLAVDALRREYGILAVDLPAGEHRLSLVLGPTPNERAGWIASGASLALLAALSAPWGRAARRRAPAAGPAGA
jgi:hypothetical protein